VGVSVVKEMTPEFREEAQLLLLRGWLRAKGVWHPKLNGRRRTDPQTPKALPIPRTRR